MSYLGLPTGNAEVLPRPRDLAELYQCHECGRRRSLVEGERCAECEARWRYDEDREG